MKREVVKSMRGTELFSFMKPAAGELWRHAVYGDVAIVTPGKSQSVCELRSGVRRKLDNSLMVKLAPSTPSTGSGRERKAA